VNAADVFLRAVFGAAPSSHYILVWTLPDKRSRFFDGETKLSVDAPGEAKTEPEDILAYIDAARTKSDVYVGVGLRNRVGGPYRRGRAIEVDVLPGLWADFDYAGEGHKKPNLPQTLEDVVEFAEGLPVRPTLIVHTGGGIHCWWLFKEPWVLDTPKERDEALDLVWRWQQTIRTRAERIGEQRTGNKWAVDSVHDLSRVLRIPGSFNRKNQPHREVVFLREPDDSLRVDPSEFDPFLVDCGKPPPSADPTQHIDADLPTADEANARMPWRKHNALLKNEDKYERTWKRKRKDLKDQSPSGYDFALANYYVMAEWDDQEILDALIVHRYDHDDQPKRLDYYAHTIKRVRDTQFQHQAIDQLEEAVFEGTVDDPLASMSEVLHFHIIKVHYLKSKTPMFALETELGNTGGLSAKQLQIFATFQAEIAGQLQHVIPHALKKKWSSLWELLVRHAEKSEGFGDSASSIQVAKDWIEEYLSDHGPTPDVKTALTQSMPFIKDDTVWIYGDTFRTWLSRKKDEKVNRHEFGEMMTTYGATSGAQDVWIHGARTTRLYWQLPSNNFVQELVQTLKDAPSHTVDQPISGTDPYRSSDTSRTNGTSHHEETPSP
jgi:hypothetical protein